MADFLDGKAFRKLLLGRKVSGNAFAHANGNVDMFNVTGGRVLITMMYGAITVAPGGAVNITAGNNPTLATGTTTAFAVAADVNGTDIGDNICFEYTAGQLTTHIGVAGINASYYIIAQTGTIFCTGDAVQGSSQWTVFYIPLEDGAKIVAI